MSLSIFLPCRAGSERVKRKNTRRFAGVGGGLLRFRGRRRKQQMEFAKDSIFHPRDGGIGKA